MIPSRASLFSFIALAALALSPACGKKDEGGGGGSGDGTGGGKGKAGAKGGSLEAVAAQADAANAAVPAELKEKITFAAAALDNGKVAALIPTGWEDNEHMPGRYKPTKDADLGFMTSYTIGTSCDGTCEPKDWAAVAGKDFEQFKGEQFTIVSDDPLDGGGRILIATSSGKTYLTAARWKDGARSYLVCHATLAGAAVPAAEAFAHACRAARSLE
jgi:hypothetical protein